MILFMLLALPLEPPEMVDMIKRDVADTSLQQVVRCWPGDIRHVDWYLECITSEKMKDLR